MVSGTLKNVSKLNSTVPIELYKAGFFRANPTASIFEAIENINGIEHNLIVMFVHWDIRINGQEGLTQWFL